MAALSQLEALPLPLLSKIAINLVIQSDSDYHPASLLPLLCSSKTLHSNLTLDGNPRLYHDLFNATFDTLALVRRYPWLVENRLNIPYLENSSDQVISDPKKQGIEYKRLWGTARRTRTTVHAGIPVVPGVAGVEHIVPDLWQLWFLATENDGRNVHFLRDHCLVGKYIQTLYNHEFVAHLLDPGYSKDTVLRALLVWIAVFAHTDVYAEEHAAAVDEKIFVIRPFVFAVHQYDVSYAPWNFKALPISAAQAREAAASAPSSPFAADLTTTSKGVDVERFGSVWHLVPPYLTLGMYVVFMRMLERQPAFMGVNQLENTTAFRPLDPDAEPSPFGLFHSPQWHPETSPSYHHDLEHKRVFVCLDSTKSSGLDPLAMRGQLQGFWRGRYLFMDFDSYLGMIGGDMRKVYDASFGQQISEMEFQELVVKVRTEDLGGKGPIKYAGFRDDGEKEDHYFVCEDENEPDEPGWSKEILLFGVGRSTWGWFTMRGRVRSWDGLVTMAMDYDPDIASITKWNWRGYIQSGGMFVGRWRDGLTKDDMRGYEGPWAMLRAGDSLYPANYPTSIAQSNGLSRTFVDSDGPPPPVYDVFGKQLEFIKCERPPLPPSTGSDVIPPLLRDMKVRIQKTSEEPSSSAATTPTPAPPLVKSTPSSTASAPVALPSPGQPATSIPSSTSAPPSTSMIPNKPDVTKKALEQLATELVQNLESTPPTAAADTASLSPQEALSTVPVSEALPGPPPIPEAAVDNLPGITGKRKRDPDDHESAALA